VRTDRPRTHGEARPVASPLSGVRIVDLCWVYAGPVLTRMLADLGAEVIKVESRRRPDGTRLGRRPLDPVGPVPEGVDVDLECQPLNHALNRRKRSVAIDLSTAEGKQVLTDLVAVSDVVTDNFAAGTMNRLGLGYEELRRVNPRIVAMSMSGAGQFGRLRDVPAYATSLAALSGLSSLVGEGENLYGVMMPTYGDSNAAIRAGGSLLVALLGAITSGQGQYVDVSEWEAGLVGLEEAILEAQLTGAPPGPRGNLSDYACPHNNFRCRGSDQWIAVSVTSDAQWAALCEVLDAAPAVSDARFSTVTARLQHRAELEDLVEGWTSDRDAGPLTAALQARGIAAFPVLSVEGQFSDEHFMDREVFMPVEHPLVGAEIVPGAPFLISTKQGAMAPPMSAAPLLGEANEYVICELLGRGRDELERLVADGVLA
jgi:crotonobetainyl-CoA:carnitine CoA-transferase CaiB-like acyl-CoA transferase